MNSLLDIAMQGRNGDTDIRVVNNEVAHVNPMEAQIIDQYGSAGEQIVSNIGSGTINPYTGLREYFRWSDYYIEDEDDRDLDIM